MQRKIRDQLKETGIGTKAQLAMKLDHEARKVERKKTSKEKRQEIEEQKYLKHQEKKKQKKKGH